MRVGDILNETAIPFVPVSNKSPVGLFIQRITLYFFQAKLGNDITAIFFFGR